MAVYFNGTTQTAHAASSPPYAAFPANLPMSNSCKANCDISGSTLNHFIIQQNAGGVSAQMTGNFSVQYNSKFANVPTSRGVWNTRSGIFASTTSRTAYVGTTSSLNTDADASSGALLRTLIGSGYNGTAFSSFWAGKLAEFVSYNATLTADEVGVLVLAEKNMLPKRLNSIKIYQPMISGINNPGYVYALTAVNSPTAADNPPIKYHSTHTLMGV